MSTYLQELITLILHVLFLAWCKHAHPYEASNIKHGYDSNWQRLSRVWKLWAVCSTSYWTDCVAKPCPIFLNFFQKLPPYQRKAGCPRLLFSIRHSRWLFLSLKLVTAVCTHGNSCANTIHQEVWDLCCCQNLFVVMVVLSPRALLATKGIGGSWFRFGRL